MGQLSFEVMNRLENEDYGEQLDDGFFMTDIGGGIPAAGPSMEVETVQRNKPKTRAERERFAEGMAAQLMDYYMEPATMNDPMILNPIRDGIPQCMKHRFVSGDANQFGCIHGCGNRERDLAGNLPVAREGTLGDAWNWVRELVKMAVLKQDKRLGYSASGVDLTGG